MEKTRDEQLLELVNAYVAIELEFREVEARQQQIYKPQKPTQITSLTGLDIFVAKRKKYEEAESCCRELRAECIRRLTQLKCQIINLLPDSNVWVKAGDYAVGKFQDAWGGLHTEIKVIKWEDTLPPLTDKLYYP